MTKVKVDEGVCNGYGHCVIEAPKYFELDDASGKAKVLKEEVADEDRAAVDSAVMLCPVQAISIDE